ncbi:Flagellar motor switch protein FliN [Maioricimonas rarisocia]|uniref:Flagellar motor switch protein FliN n=1 Tax=Maioricimonas rarisocia TaxID=2528026 RepID=A0A517ZCP1_9PLAN|nr:flagellar motor switch protein FliN [Maioricimonas rarisocia]QDU40229.1 Flagellar motor switch protein FliN [Maioricimonas rarisocia]
MNEPANNPGQRETTPVSPNPVDDISAGAESPEVRPVEFSETSRSQSGTGRLPIKRFYDVNVTVSVELGRVTMSIGELLQLGEGAVVELTRSVHEPVDIVAQSVRLARGEVVVVGDRYAVRVTEIEPVDHDSPLMSLSGSSAGNEAGAAASAAKTVPSS